ncbi:MAG TPA: ACT domain-containing protein [archaeon]|nr:ACT domain-containing protein [archaeon]
MLKVNGNGNSLSEEIRKEIDVLPHAKMSLAEGIVNYSALARKMLPDLEKKFGKKLNEESIIVAIKRYADELDKDQPYVSYIDSFAQAQIVLQDNMCYSHFKKTKNVVAKVDELFAKEDWNMGEMRVLIHGADQVMTIMKENRIRDLLEELSDDVIYSLKNNSLVTMTMPFESFGVYGIIAEMTSLLAKKGINIELLSSPPDIHFLVDEKDAERAYSALRKLINDSKEAQKAAKGK